MNDLRDYLTAPSSAEVRTIPTDAGQRTESAHASASASPEQAPLNPEPVQFTSTTPSGIEVLYQASPKRLYKVRRVDGRPAVDSDWIEVPSVTTVLGVLDKPALPWWGMKIGVSGVLQLAGSGILRPGPSGDLGSTIGSDWTYATTDSVVDLLTDYKLTVNHVRDKAGDRGTSVHKALEDWADWNTTPVPEDYPDSERGYVEGVRRFLADLIGNTYVKDIQSEVMVGSVEHGYAGRYDLRLSFGGGNLVTKHYPKKTDRVEEIPAGRLLLDLKTSSGVYPSHFMQLEAYEEASRECGYEDTDRRAVVRVSDDGFYEFVTSPATFDDFLSVKSTYDALARIKGKK